MGKFSKYVLVVDNISGKRLERFVCCTAGSLSGAGRQAGASAWQGGLQGASYAFSCV